MKKLLVVLPLTAAMAFGSAVPARADGSTDAALALGAFAVFNQLVRGETVLNNIFGGPRAVVHERIVVHQPPVVVHQPPAVVYAPPLPPPVVVYKYSAPAYPYGPVYYRHVPPGHFKPWNRGHWKHRD
jgi:hypothetical protein